MKKVCLLLGLISLSVSIFGCGNTSDVDSEVVTAETESLEQLVEDVVEENKGTADKEGVDNSVSVDVETSKVHEDELEVVKQKNESETFTMQDKTFYVPEGYKVDNGYSTDEFTLLYDVANESFVKIRTSLTPGDLEHYILYGEVDSDDEYSDYGEVKLGDITFKVIRRIENNNFITYEVVSDGIELSEIVNPEPNIEEQTEGIELQSEVTEGEQNNIEASSILEQTEPSEEQQEVGNKEADYVTEYDDIVYHLTFDFNGEETSLENIKYLLNIILGDYA